MTTAYGPVPQWPWVEGVFHGIKPSALKVYCCMCAYANGSTWNARPGIDVLADGTGMDERHVRRHLRTLESIGVIRATAYALGGRGRATAYDIVAKEKGGESRPSSFGQKGGILPGQILTETGADFDQNGGKNSPPNTGLQKEHQQQQESGLAVQQEETQGGTSPPSQPPDRLEGWEGCQDALKALGIHDPTRTGILVGMQGRGFLPAQAAFEIGKIKREASDHRNRIGTGLIVTRLRAAEPPKHSAAAPTPADSAPLPSEADRRAASVALRQMAADLRAKRKGGAA